MTKTLILLAATLMGLAHAQTPQPLPEKLQQMQENYNSAIARVTAPIKNTYLKELEKLKADYTKTGHLQSALATDELIKAVRGSADASDLSKMSVPQFKKWLESVKITEVDSPYGNVFVYENDVLTSMRPDRAGSRTHSNVTIEVGRLLVPFTNTSANIVISPSLNEAEVTYSGGGGKFKATVSKK